MLLKTINDAYTSAYIKFFLLPPKSMARLATLSFEDDPGAFLFYISVKLRGNQLIITSM